MSCHCHSSPCSCNSCDPENEPLASELNNLVLSLIGVPTKSCVNNQIVWVLPCDLDAGIPEFPKNSGESIACYFLRFMSVFGIGNSSGLKGYETTVLAASNEDLVAQADVENQDFSGTLTAPVFISLSSSNASAGDSFYISLTGLVVTAINSLTIKSDATTLLTLDTAGTLNGYIKAVWTGTAWKLTQTTVNLT